MNNKILWQDLIDGLAARSGVSRKDADTFTRTFFTLLEDSLRVEKLVKIKGLGTFKLVEVSSRESVNVNTGERFLIDGHSKISFTPETTLRDLINKPFADFETVVLHDSTSTEEMERIEIEDDLEDEGIEDEVIAPAPLVTETEALVDELPSVSDGDVEPESIPDAPQAGAVEAERKEEDVESDATISSQPEESEMAQEFSAPREEIPMSDSDEDVSSQCENTADIPVEETPVSAVEHTEIPSKSALVQHVEQQQIEELNVASQHVEHQTIEQRTVNPKERSGLRLGWGSFVLLLLVTIALMVGSYIAGHFDVLSFSKEKPVSVASASAVSTTKANKSAVVPELVSTVENDSTSINSNVEEPSVGADTQADQKDNVKPVPPTESASVQKPAETTQKPVPVTSTSEQKTTTQKPESKPVNTQAQTKTAGSQADSTAKDSSVHQQQSANPYPQVSKGKYTIVGVKATHTLKSGETLLKLSRTYYNGSNDFAKYIIIMNNIKNPDVVPEGAVLKIPELTPKE